MADGGHRRRLGEHLGVGADADLEILRPHLLLDEEPLQRHRRLGARLEPGEVVADRRRHLGADRGGLLGRAARLLLDHPLEHRDREGDAGRLHRLEVDRREQKGLARVARCAGRVGEDLGEGAHRLALHIPRQPGRLGRFAEVAHGGRGRADVDQLHAAEGHHGRTAQFRAPDAAGQRRDLGIVGKGEGGAHVERHGVSSSGFVFREGHLSGWRGVPSSRSPSLRDGIGRRRVGRHLAAADHALEVALLVRRIRRPSPPRRPSSAADRRRPAPAPRCRTG